MKENFTSINIILDRSGSMGPLRNDTIGSFNTFLKDQKAFPGEAVFTLCTFNEHRTTVCDFAPISTVPDLNPETYSPSGGTALLDALAQTIDDIGVRLSSLSEDQRPSKVLVVVITDGQENSSRSFTLADVQQKVQHQTSVYSWQFVFLGASLDQINDAVGLGVSTGSTLQYDFSKSGIHASYNSLSSSTTTYRSSATPISENFFNQTPANPTPAPTTPVIPGTPSTGTGGGSDTTATGSTGNKPVNYRHSQRDDKSGRFSPR